MQNKEDALNDVHALASHVSRTIDELWALLDAYHAIEMNIDDVLNDIYVVRSNISKLHRALEADELPIDEDTESMLKRLYDARDKISSDIKALYVMNAGARKTPSALSDVSSTVQDILDLTRQFQ